MGTLFWIGFVLLAGYGVGRLTGRFRLPRVTGYLLVGVAMSPSATGVLPGDFIAQSQTLVHFALAVIAFMIGGSLKFEKVKKLEKSILSIMIAESELAFLLVSAGLALALMLGLISFGLPNDGGFVAALFLGAISASTAPAAVLAVIHQYRAKGPLTLTILGVVATDDAVALINVSLATGAVSLLFGASQGPWYAALTGVLVGIGASILFGASAGWLHGHHLNRLNLESSQVISTFGILLLLYGVMEFMGWDGLLAAMSFGMALVNTGQKSDAVFETIRLHFEETIFVLFFVVSGATMEPDVLTQVWPAALLYVALRLAGKVAGSRVGGALSGAPDAVRRSIGPALMPQAGVAVGLALMLYHHPVYGGVGIVVLNCVIAATVINEIAGPLLLKSVLVRSGEAKEAP